MLKKRKKITHLCKQTKIFDYRTNIIDEDLMKNNFIVKKSLNFIWKFNKSYIVLDPTRSGTENHVY